jgi:hypothetical protein
MGLIILVIRSIGAPVRMMLMLMKQQLTGDLPELQFNWISRRIEVWMHDISSLWSRAEGKD